MTPCNRWGKGGPGEEVEADMQTDRSRAMRAEDGVGRDQLGTCGNREKDGELGCQAVQASSPDSSQ